MNIRLYKFILILVILCGLEGLTFSDALAKAEINLDLSSNISRECKEIFKEIPFFKVDLTPIRKNNIINPVSYNFLARLYTELGDLDIAIQVTKKASYILNDAESHIKLGDLYKQKSNHRQAIHHYQKAIDIEATNIEARVKFASMFEFNEDGVRYGPNFNFEKAFLQYRKILEINPKFVEIYYRIGLLYKNR